MTLRKLKEFLDSTGTQYSTFTKKVYMDDNAVKLGATTCICVRNAVSFYFNKQGELLGTGTDAIRSWMEAKRRQRLLNGVYYVPEHDYILILSEVSRTLMVDEDGVDGVAWVANVESDESDNISKTRGCITSTKYLVYLGEL
jgi:hypothetical protein